MVRAGRENPGTDRSPDHCMQSPRRSVRRGVALVRMNSRGRGRAMASPPVVLKLLKYMTLGDRELALLEGLGRGQRTVGAGAQLLDPREMYSTAFLINDGWALRYRAFPDGRRQIINF